MLHVTPTSAVACVHTHVPSLHPDAELLALAPALQAAATPYLSYDRDNYVTRADSDYDEAIETARTLWANVRDIADRILTKEPRTLVGLLVIAQAAALMAEERWTEAPEFVGPEGRLLRLVCNPLFQLAGIDWRGQSVADVDRMTPAMSAPAPACDAPLIRLAEAAIAEERAANAVVEACEHDTPRGTFDEALRLLERVTALDARTPAGLAAKARLLLTHIPDGEEFDGDFRCEALALAIARDAVNLDAGGDAVTAPAEVVGLWRALEVCQDIRDVLGEHNANAEVTPFLMAAE